VSFRFTFGRVLPTVGAAVLVAAATTACGGGSGSGNGGAGANETSSTQASSQGASAADWTQSFCTDTHKWRTSLQKAAATLKASPGSKTTANAALNDAKSATILFAQQLSTLGPPPGGQQATQQLKLYGQRLRYDNQNVQGEWNSPAGNAQALAQKVATVRGTLITMVKQVQQAAGYVRQLPSNSQLRKAFASNSTCTAAFAKS
jgi:hypothetical protein